MTLGVDPGFWRDRTVLITGHTGFKGAWLALWLQLLGARVVGLSRAAPSDPSLYALARVGEEMVEVAGDVRDFDAVCEAVIEQRPDVVFHLAAQALVRSSLSDPRTTYEVNVMGTVNLLEAVRRAGGVRALVNVTSDKCYENREWEWGYREYEPMGGHDPYSSSKACSELVTAAFRASFFAGEQETRVASARAGNVIGGGDWATDRLIPDLMRAALAGETLVVRNPDSVRPWQHVLEPLEGYLTLARALCESPSFAEGWNFGPSAVDDRPVRWVVERAVELWPQRVRWTAAPPAASVESRILKLDSARARERLGWSPRWSLDDALARTVEWFQAYEAGDDMRSFTQGQIEAHAGELRREAG
jgi:CDP-glucose 4,6-dehydratase